MMNMSSRTLDFMALLAGIGLAFAFSPFDYSLLALFALVLLFVSWENANPRRAFWRGYLFGLGIFGIGVSWVFVSVYFYGGANLIGSGLLTIFFVLVWACFPALTGYLAALLKSKHSLVNLLIIPLVWVLVENIRGYWLLNGFPWLQIAYSQLDSPLAGFGPIFGVYGMGFVLALSAAVIAYVLRHKAHQVSLTVLIAGFWLAGYFLKQVEWTLPIAAPIKVALIQGNISQDQKWVADNRLNTLLKYKQLTQENLDAQVIVWPETAIPAFLSQVDDFFLTPLEEEVKKHHVDLIVSLPMQGTKEDEIYNGVLSLGHTRAVYKKNHLLPFGEYLPLQPLSGWVLQVLGIHLGDFTAGGDDQPLLQAGGYRFVTSICYEDAFAGEAIRHIADAAYLVNVTNDGWFGDSLEPHQHMQIARMRALETGRYLLRATNTGITGIVDPKGQIIKQAPTFTTSVLKGEIKPMTGMTPYARIGDQIVLSVLVIMLLGLLAYDRIVKPR